MLPWHLWVEVPYFTIRSSELKLVASREVLEFTVMWGPEIFARTNFTIVSSSLNAIKPKLRALQTPLFQDNTDFAIANKTCFKTFHVSKYKTRNVLKYSLLAISKHRKFWNMFCSQKKVPSQPCLKPQVIRTKRIRLRWSAIDIDNWAWHIAIVRRSTFCRHSCFFLNVVLFASIPSLFW